MAVESTLELELGTRLDTFELNEVTTGDPVRVEADGRPVLVMFICVHCPFVIHVQGELARLGRDYGEAVNMVAINSNDVGRSPGDSPAAMIQQARDAGFPFPYLYDEDQQVARSMHAACTPDFFLFGQDGRLAYRGRLDDARPRGAVPTGSELRAALDAVLAGRAIPTAEQLPSIGCSIKWAE